MTPDRKRLIRRRFEPLAVLIVVVIGVAFIVSILPGCGSVNPPGTMAGHNTTLPAQPACLLFCFAEVRSSIDTPTPAEPTRDKKGKSIAPPVVVPPPVINSAPTTKPPAVAPPVSSRP
ncbi:hypothetical protein AWB78_06490 [Caballeronia calidae]|uniref:Uncharacterized protein n=1 Tax=Caballeronia calidae TaxID=1777139 RepID=A0A158E9H5_9BURK|nr:hypothetical protein [Caballeronia calidae]SAL03046.1 hypothetical protein AWB78_06490 [Caballeronia calidae]